MLNQTNYYVGGKKSAGTLLKFKKISGKCYYKCRFYISENVIMLTYKII